MYESLILRKKHHGVVEKGIVGASTHHYERYKLENSTIHPLNCMVVGLRLIPKRFKFILLPIRSPPILINDVKLN